MESARKNNLGVIVVMVDGASHNHEKFCINIYKPRSLGKLSSGLRRGGSISDENQSSEIYEVSSNSYKINIANIYIYILLT